MKMTHQREISSYFTCSTCQCYFLQEQNNQMQTILLICIKCKVIKIAHFQYEMQILKTG